MAPSPGEMKPGHAPVDRTEGPRWWVGLCLCQEEVCWPLSCPALPVTCDGKVLCLGQTLHVASPAAEAPQTSQHSCLHQKPLTLTDLSARAQGVPRGLSGLVEAGGRRHGLSPGHWQGLVPA